MDASRELERLKEWAGVASKRGGQDLTTPFLFSGPRLRAARGHLLRGHLL